jgi:hypothetical protein
MSSSKKLACKGTLQQVFICLILRIPYPFPPPYTLYSVYSILIHTGKGGGEEVEPKRKLEEQQLTKLGRKYQHD